MSALEICGRAIDAPIGDVLNALREATGKPRDFRRRGDNYQVTCPFHKNGQEGHPSCQIYCGSGDVEYGYMHCFTCGEGGPLWHFAGACLGGGDDVGRKWLVDNFAGPFMTKSYNLPPLEFGRRPDKAPLDASLLKRLQPWHPYMEKRHLRREVCERFGVGYDPEGDCIVFPVWDDRGNLAMFTRRSVSGKRFMVDADVEKPVYLLNEVKAMGCLEVTVVESQINCLTLWGWGIPSVALFGTGTKSQAALLAMSGIRTYYLALDGDDAGRRGTKRLVESLPPTTIKHIIELPHGKDVNDLTQEEFDSLPIREAHDWLLGEGAKNGR